jgi:phosphatidylglycerophosphate synthase
MDTIPSRRSLASATRTVLTYLERRMFLPDINPSYYDALGIILSVLYLYAQSPGLKVVIIILVLLADWFDGATARQYKKESKAGYIVDVLTDRVSEALIFSAEAGTALGQVLFLLWLINLCLTFYSLYSNKHTSLPLRFALLILLIVGVL